MSLHVPARLVNYAIAEHIENLGGIIYPTYSSPYKVYGP